MHSPPRLILKEVKTMSACYQFQNWMNGNFPLAIFAVILWGGMILFGLGYLLLRFFRVLKSRLTEQNRERYDYSEILRTRYTKGEISDEEFVRMKNVLLEL